MLSDASRTSTESSKKIHNRQPEVDKQDPNSSKNGIKKLSNYSIQVKINPHWTPYCALLSQCATVPRMSATTPRTPRSSAPTLPARHVPTPISRAQSLDVTIDPRDIVLTTKQTADLLGISPATFRGWVSRGLFPKKDGEHNEKSPYWKMTTVTEYLRNAPGGRLPYTIGS